MFSLGPSLLERDDGDSTPTATALPAFHWSFARKKRFRWARKQGASLRTACRLPAAQPCLGWAASHPQAAVDEEHDAIEPSGAPATDGLCREAGSPDAPGSEPAASSNGGPDPRGSSPQAQGTDAARKPGTAFWQAPFVPSIMVGWMHTLSDVQLFLDNPNEEDVNEDMLWPREVPAAVKRFGRDVEDEIRRHRQAMARLVCRMKPFFVSDEAKAVYRLLMTGEYPGPGSEAASPGGSQANEQLRQGVAHEPPSPRGQTGVVSLKTALALLCAYPQRCCLIRSEAEDDEEETHGSWGRWWPWAPAGDHESTDSKEAMAKKGTPVFTVPGVYISIDSVLGPIKMQPLFLKHALLYDMLETAEQILIKWEVVKRRVARKLIRQKILTAISPVTEAPSSGPADADDEEEEEDSNMDPPEVNEFLAEMGESGGTTTGGGGRSPQGILGVVSTIAYGVVAVGLSSVGAVQDLADQLMFSNTLCRHLMGQQVEFGIKAEVLEEVVGEVIEHNRTRVPQLAVADSYDMGGAPSVEGVPVLLSAVTGLLDNMMTHVNGLTGVSEFERDGTKQIVEQLKRHHELTQSRDKRMMSILRRLEYGGYTNADAESLAAILSMAAILSSSPSVFLDNMLDGLGGWSFMKSLSLKMGPRVSAPTGWPPATASGSSSGGSASLADVSVEKDEDEPDSEIVVKPAARPPRLARRGPDGVLQITGHRKGDKFEITISSTTDADKSASSQGQAAPGPDADKLSGHSSSIKIEIDLAVACGDEDSDEDEDAQTSEERADLSEAASATDAPKDDQLRGFLLVGDLLPLYSLDSDRPEYDWAFRPPPVQIGNIGDATRIQACDFPPHQSASVGNDAGDKKR